MLDLFYIHVPKTGGTSIEAYMRKALRAKRFLGHCETLSLQQCSEEISQYQVASGHVRFHQLVSSGIRYKRLMTSVRDPRAQLVSHLRWLIRIGEDESSAFHKHHPDHIRSTAVKLAGTDFSDKAVLESYITEMTSTEIGLFDNFLVRFLTPLHVAGRVKQNHVDAAIAALPKFDFIVRTEQLHEDVARLFATIGYPQPRREIRKNIDAASKDKLALGENIEILRELYRYDLMLIAQM